jgi:hypothetical protein
VQFWQPWSGGRAAFSPYPFLPAAEIAKMNYTLAAPPRYALLREERYQIYALKKAGHTQNEIAREMERNKLRQR